MPLSVADVSVGFTAHLGNIFKALDSVSKKLDNLTNKDFTVKLQVDTKTASNVSKIAEKLDILGSAFETVAKTGKSFLSGIGLDMESLQSRTNKSTARIKEDLGQLGSSFSSRLVSVGTIIDRLFNPALVATIFSTATGISLLASNGFNLTRVLGDLGRTGSGAFAIVRNSFKLMSDDVTGSNIQTFLSSLLTLAGSLGPKIIGSTSLILLSLNIAGKTARSLLGFLQGANPNSAIGQTVNIIQALNKGLFSLEFRTRRSVAKINVFVAAATLLAGVVGKVSLGLTGVFSVIPIGLVGIKLIGKLVGLAAINVQSRIFRIRAALGDGKAQFRVFLFSLRQLGPLLNGIGNVSKPLGKALEQLGKVNPKKLGSAIKTTVDTLLSSFEMLTANVQKMVDILDKRLPKATRALKTMGREIQKIKSDTKGPNSRGPPDGGNIIGDTSELVKEVTSKTTQAFRGGVSKAQGPIRSALSAITPRTSRIFKSYFIGSVVMRLPEVASTLASMFASTLAAAASVGSAEAAVTVATPSGAGASVGFGLIKGIGAVLATPVVWKTLFAIGLGRAIVATKPLLVDISKKFASGVVAGSEPIFGKIKSTLGQFFAGVSIGAKGAGNTLATSFVGNFETTSRQKFVPAFAKINAALNGNGPIGKIASVGKSLAFSFVGAFAGISGGLLTAFGSKKLGPALFEGARKAFSKSKISSFLRNTFKIAGALIPGIAADTIRIGFAAAAAIPDLLSRLVPASVDFKKTNFAARVLKGGPFAATKLALAGARKNQGLEPIAEGIDEKETRSNRQKELAALVDKLVLQRGRELAGLAETTGKDLAVRKKSIEVLRSTIAAHVKELAQLDGINQPGKNSRRKAVVAQLVTAQERLVIETRDVGNAFDALTAQSDAIVAEFEPFAAELPELAPRFEAVSKVAEQFVTGFKELPKAGVNLVNALRKLTTAASTPGSKVSPFAAIGDDAGSIDEGLRRFSEVLDDSKITRMSAMMRHGGEAAKDLARLNVVLKSLPGHVSAADVEFAATAKILVDLRRAEGTLVNSAQRLATATFSTPMEKLGETTANLFEAFGTLERHIDKAVSPSVEFSTQSIRAAKALARQSTAIDTATSATTQLARATLAHAIKTGEGLSETGSIAGTAKTLDTKELQRNVDILSSLLVALGRSTAKGFTQNVGIDRDAVRNKLQAPGGQFNKGGRDEASQFGRGFQAQGGKAMIEQLNSILLKADSADTAFRSLLTFVDSQGIEAAHALELMAAAGRELVSFGSNSSRFKNLIERFGGQGPKITGILQSLAAMGRLKSTTGGVLDTLFSRVDNSPVLQASVGGAEGMQKIKSAAARAMASGVAKGLDVTDIVANISNAIQDALKGLDVTPTELKLSKAKVKEALTSKLTGILDLGDLFATGTGKIKGFPDLEKFSQRSFKATAKSFQKAGATLGDEMTKGTADFEKRLKFFFDSTLGHHAHFKSPPAGVVGKIVRSWNLTGATLGAQMMKGAPEFSKFVRLFFDKTLGFEAEHHSLPFGSVGRIESSFALAGITIGQQLLRGVNGLRDSARKFFQQGFGGAAEAARDLLVGPVEAATTAISGLLGKTANVLTRFRKGIARRTPWWLQLTLVPLVIRGFLRIGSTITRIGSIAVKAIGGLLVGSLNAATAAMKKFSALVTETSKKTREFGFSAKRTGASTQEFDQLSIAMRRFNVDATEVSQSLIVLQQSTADALRDPTGEAAKNFALAGIALKDLKDADPVGLLFQIAQAASDTEGPGELRRTLGLVGAEMTNLKAALTDSDGFAEEFRKAASHKLIDQDEVAAARLVVDALHDAQRLVEDINRTIIRALRPITELFLSVFRSSVLNKKPKILTFIEVAMTTVSAVVLKTVGFVQNSLKSGTLKSDIKALASFALLQLKRAVGAATTSITGNLPSIGAKVSKIFDAVVEDLFEQVPRRFAGLAISISSTIVKIAGSLFTKLFNLFIRSIPGPIRIAMGATEIKDKSVEEFLATINFLAGEQRNVVDKLVGSGAGLGGNLIDVLTRMGNAATKAAEKFRASNPRVAQFLDEVRKLAGDVPQNARDRMLELAASIETIKDRTERQIQQKILVDFRNLARAALAAKTALERFRGESEAIDQMVTLAGDLGEGFNRSAIEMERGRLQLEASLTSFAVAIKQNKQLEKNARAWFNINSANADVVKIIGDRMREAFEMSQEIKKLQRVASTVTSIFDIFDAARQSNPFIALEGLIGAAELEAKRLNSQLTLTAKILKEKLLVQMQNMPGEFRAAAKGLQEIGVIPLSIDVQSADVEDIFKSITEGLQAAINTQVRNKILKPIAENVRETLVAPIVTAFGTVFRGLADGSIFEAARTAGEAAREAGIKFSKMLFVVSKIGESIFASALENLFATLQEKVTEGLTKAVVGALTDSSVNSAIAALGKKLEGTVKLAVSGLLAVLGLVLSRLQSTATATADSIDSVVRSSEQVRGVISGDSTIALKEVGEQLADALKGTESRLDMLIALAQLSLTGGDPVPGVPVSPLAGVAVTGL